ncbi:hypothetical protein LLG10_02745 [bacterium]|nr:hypothetical protein [bacterium]
MDNLVKKAFFLVMVILLLLPTACQKKAASTITVAPFPLASEKSSEQNEIQEKWFLTEVYAKEMFFKEKHFEVGYYKPIGIYDHFFEYYYQGDLCRLNLDNYTEEIKPGALNDFWYAKYDSSIILSDNQAYYYLEEMEDRSQTELYHINLICKDRKDLAIIWKIYLYTGEYFSLIDRLYENETSLFASVSQTYQLFCIDKKDGSIQWVFEPAKTDKKVVFRSDNDCMADIGNKSISCEFVHDDGVIVHLSSVDQQGSANIYNQYYLVSFDGKLLNTLTQQPLYFFEDTYFYQDKRFFGYKKIHNNQIVWKKPLPSKEESRYFQMGDYMIQTIENPAGLSVTIMNVRNGSIGWEKIIPSTKLYAVNELGGNYYILFQDRKEESRYRVITWNAQTKQGQWIEITNQIEKKHTPKDDWIENPSFDEYFVNDVSIVSSSGNVYILTGLGMISLHGDQATYYPYKTDTVTYNISLFSNQTIFVLSYTVGGQGIVPGGKILILKDTPEEEPGETKEKGEIGETIPDWKEENYKQGDPDFKKGKSKIVSDPYLEIWNAEVKESIGVYRLYLSRFYKDLNGDGIPELFLSWFGGTGGRQFLIYQITKDGYRYLQNMFMYSLEVLDENHNGYQDIQVFARLGAGPGGGTTNGSLSRYEFNGEYYISKKSMEITEEHASRANLFHPEQNNREEHPSIDTLHWSPKDDDPYRK